MKIIVVNYLALIIILSSVQGIIEDGRDEDLDLVAHENKLSDQIRAVLEHYKHPDPIGLPGVPVPDPIAIPAMEQKLKLGGTMYLKNASVHGLSKFKIERLESNLANMQVEIALSYTKLEVLGNYTLSMLFSRSNGKFNITLAGVYFEGIANLEVARDGNLEAASINMDITFHDVVVDFKNLSFMASVVQGMINTIGPFVFDSIKPFILGEISTNVRKKININLRSINQTFPNSIPPLDLAIAEGRKFVREQGYDPYKVEDYKQSSGIFSIDITDIWISGLASFYRTGNITVSMMNNTLELGLQMATTKLEGKCKWKVSLGGFLSKYGASIFSIDYLQIKTKLNQTLNLHNKPKLEEIKLLLGNIQLRMDGIGTTDYILEFLANVLPNILRYQIVDGMEEILKQNIQEILDSIDVEKSIENELLKMDNMTNPNDTFETKTFINPAENFLDFEELYEDIMS